MSSLIDGLRDRVQLRSRLRVEPSVRDCLQRVVVLAAIAAIAVQWMNTRGGRLVVTQNPAHREVMNTYTIYHIMAMGLREGHIGQVDVAAAERYWALKNPSAVYERQPGDAQHVWANYYTLDIGYSFIVEAARLFFPSLPDNDFRPLALQLVVDVATIFFVFFVFLHWNFWLGLAAAYLYVSVGPFYDLAAIAFYYFWDIPIALVVLGSLILAYRRSSETMLWLTVGALALGVGVWLRGSWWPLSLFMLLVVLTSRAMRAKLLVPVAAFALVATPQVVRSSLARGQLTFTTRAVWHVALVGLGYYPNPYGLEMNDGAVFALTKAKRGVQVHTEDYYTHDMAAKQEFMVLWRIDRSFIIRSFLGRLRDSLAGSTQTSVESLPWFSNIVYRLACFAGFLAMLFRGGDARPVGIGAAGMHVIYVTLTSVFYFVGLAYSSVAEVTLLVLFIGGLDAARHAAVRALRPSPAA
jgi:hypothetical protein